MRISLCLCATNVTQFWDRTSRLDFRRLWKKEKKKKDVEDYYFYLDKSYLSLNK